MLRRGRSDDLLIGLFRPTPRPPLCLSPPEDIRRSLIGHGRVLRGLFETGAALSLRAVCRVSSLFLYAAHIVWRALAMLTRLVHEHRTQQFGWVELADRKAVKPCFLPACQAMKLRSPCVPQLDVDAVGAALAEEQDRHLADSIRGANKRQTSAFFLASWAARVVVFGGVRSYQVGTSRGRRMAVERRCRRCPH